MEQQMQSDHDLLVTLVANVSSMRDEMRQNSSQVTITTTDHETRIRLLQNDNAVLRGQIDGAAKSAKVAYTIFGLLITILGVIGTWGLVVK